MLDEKYFSYVSPITDRYNSKILGHIWSRENRYILWRKLWLNLAISQKKLGVKITNEQIEEMKFNLDNIDLNEIEIKEKIYKHEVIANIAVFGDLCKKSKSIIHLGATSCYVTDNADLIQIRDSLKIIRNRLITIIKKLTELADKYSDLAMLGFTHYQPAQIITFGKRLCVYIQDFIFDINRLDYELDNLVFRGTKGAVGTQSGFLTLFNGDHKKVVELDRMIALEMGFKKSLSISNQTYTRKIDYYILSVLSGIAQTAYKISNDIRLLSNLGEIREPFYESQIGSSAMAYKKNPIHSERICSLSRYIISLSNNSVGNYSMQWLERTLDDSGNRRILLPEIFILSDFVLSSIYKIINGLQVYPDIISSHIDLELPTMIMENIILEMVKQGGDRQLLHEAMKKHIMNFNDNKIDDLLCEIKKDPLFKNFDDKHKNLYDLNKLMGRSKEQVRDFLKNDVANVLNKFKEDLLAIEDILY